MNVSQAIESRRSIKGFDPDHRMSKEEIDKALKESEAHAAEDKKKRNLIEAKNVADNSIYSAEKVLTDLGEKVPEELKSEVRSAIDEVRKVKDGEDEDAIRKAVDVLSQAVQKCGAAAYQQAEQQPEAESGAPESGQDTEPGPGGEAN